MGFVLDDGLGSAATFEFTSDGSVAFNRTAIPFTAGQSASMVRTSIISAINGAGMLITASAGTQASVVLTHDFATSLGNQTIVEAVGDDSFFVGGMSGGRGGDCGQGVTCALNADCASGTCTGVCE